MRDTVETNPTSSKQHQGLRFLDCSLRISVIPFSVASLWLMAQNKQVNDDFGKVEFSNLTGMKYLVCINAISAGYALASAVFSFLSCFTNDWVLFVLDQVIAYLMVTSGSAVAEILYLAYEGDKDVAWSEACNYYGRFCNRAKVSLAFHFMALVCFLALSLISAYRLFSKFEAPVSSKDVVEQGD